MTLQTVLPLFALMGLGAFHGLNPAMGWMFAVAFGLQEGRWSAVLRAFVPILVGHAAALALWLALLNVLQMSLPWKTLSVLCAALLIGVGAYHAWRPHGHHPQPPHMNGFSLAGWSFLAASAHGAGLMLMPLMLAFQEVCGPLLAAMGQGGHAQMEQQFNTVTASLGAAPLIIGVVVGLHTVAMLLAMAAASMVAYDRLERSAQTTPWLKLNVAWAAALMLSGAVLLIF